MGVDGANENKNVACSALAYATAPETTEIDPPLEESAKVEKEGAGAVEMPEEMVTRIVPVPEEFVGSVTLVVVLTTGVLLLA